LNSTKNEKINSKNDWDMRTIQTF